MSTLWSRQVCHSRKSYTREERLKLYLEAQEAVVHARHTLLYNTIGCILVQKPFRCVIAGNKILAALRRNKLNKELAVQRTAQIMQQILGRFGLERLMAVLPYVNAYR